MNPDYTLRPGTVADVETIAHHREAMFRDMGTGTDEDRATMRAHATPWIRAHVQDGTYLAFFAITQSEDSAETVAAGAGLWIMEWTPTMFIADSRRGYLLNVYTEPEHRHRGLARLLVARCMDECRARGIAVLSLHASEFGRSLYLRMGFTPTNEMRVVFEDG